MPRKSAKKPPVTVRAPDVITSTTSTSAISPRPPLNENEAKKIALGALLSFYRRVRQIERKDLAGASGLSRSLLGMIENGARLPTDAALDRIGTNLELNSFQRLQLKAIAGYSGQLPEARGSEVRPSDLIEGTPLFLRQMRSEAEFQDTLPLDEVWIVTRRPMSLEAPFLKWLRRKLLNSDCSYTYFVDARFGETDFDTLRDRLEIASDPEWVRKSADRRAKELPDQLRFVLCPPALTATNHTIALFNPRSTTKPKFGRVAYYDNGDAIGVHSIDKSLYDQVVSLLRERIVDCERFPDEPVPRDPTLHGSYRLIKLP